MALINCPDCNNQVSTSAVACPQCGAPIAEYRQSEAAGVSLTTTQETSKKFKLHSLISLLSIFLGFALSMILMGEPGEKTEPSMMGLIPGIMIIGGIIWFIVTKFRIWWHHK